MVIVLKFEHFIIFFSNKMAVIKAGINKMLVRKTNFIAGLKFLMQHLACGSTSRNALSRAQARGRLGEIVSLMMAHFNLQ